MSIYSFVLKRHIYRGLATPQEIVSYVEGLTADGVKDFMSDPSNTSMVSDEQASSLYKKYPAPIRKEIMRSSRVSSAWKKEAVSKEKSSSVLAEIWPYLETSTVVELAESKKVFAKALLQNFGSVEGELSEALTASSDFLKMSFDVCSGSSVKLDLAYPLLELFKSADDETLKWAFARLDEAAPGDYATVTNYSTYANLATVLLEASLHDGRFLKEDVDLLWFKRTLRATEIGTRYYNSYYQAPAIEERFRELSKQFVEIVFKNYDTFSQTLESDTDVFQDQFKNVCMARKIRSDIPEADWFAQYGTPVEPPEVAAARLAKEEAEKLANAGFFAARDAIQEDLDAGKVPDFQSFITARSVEEIRQIVTDLAYASRENSEKLAHVVYSCGVFNRSLVKSLEDEQEAYSRFLNPLQGTPTDCDYAVARAFQLNPYDSSKEIHSGMVQSFLMRPNVNITDVSSLFYGMLGNNVSSAFAVRSTYYYYHSMYGSQVLENLLSTSWDAVDHSKFSKFKEMVLKGFFVLFEENPAAKMDLSSGVVSTLVKNGSMGLIPACLLWDGTNPSDKISNELAEYLYGVLGSFDSESRELFQELSPSWRKSIDDLTSTISGTI